MIDNDLLAIIGLIYDAVIHPSGWYAAVDAVRLRHGWANGSMGVLALPSRTGIVNTGVNIPEEMARLPSLMQDTVGMWGGAERMVAFPLEEPMIQSEQTDPATWHQYKLAADHALPAGLIDQVGIILVRDQTTYAFLGFAQHKSMRRHEGLLDELRMLAPHFRRAATVSRILETMASRLATFEAAFEHTGSGGLLVRGDMQVVHANGAAEALIDGRDPLQVSNGELRLSGQIAPGQLEIAVAAAAEGHAAIGRKGIGIPARRRDGSPVVVHVMPLKSPNGRELDADAAIFINDAAGAEPASLDVLSALFGLTPAEARTMDLIVAGRSSTDAAREMCVAPSTLRTHLLRVYDKTGRHSRAELVRLARELKL